MKRTDFIREHYKKTFPDREVIFIEIEGINCFVKGKDLYMNNEIAHRLSEPQLKALIDHEISHIKHNHVQVNRIYLFGWIAQTMLPFFFIPCIPIWIVIISSLLLFISFGFIYRNILRKQEFQADQDALRFNGLNTMIRMLIEIANTDLFKTSFSHPSIRERINRLNSGS